MKGDKKSWIKMKKYNAQDVILLEKIYLHLLPYMKSTVIYISENNCPRCGSDKVTSRGYGINLGTRYRRFQCQSCGGWFKGEKSEKIMKVNREI
jgi:transposase-like protein